MAAVFGASGGRATPDGRATWLRFGESVEGRRWPIRATGCGGGGSGERTGRRRGCREAFRVRVPPGVAQPPRRPRPGQGVDLETAGGWAWREVTRSPGRLLDAELRSGAG